MSVRVVGALVLLLGASSGAAVAAPTCGELAALRSMHGPGPVTLRLWNARPSILVVDWIDYDGRRMP
jgi:hypothetical protein